MDGMQVFQTRDGGESWIPADANLALISAEQLLPPGSVIADFSDALHGWALVQNGSCLGEKDTNAVWECQQETRLWQTDDGGHTWRPVDLLP